MVEIPEREYTIGEAAQILNEEIHNLRYWQRELGLPDHRNEMNQRVYTQSDINTLRFVKELRNNENLSLKAIKKILKRTDIIKDEEPVSTEIMPANNIDYTVAIRRLSEELCTHISKYIENSNRELKDEIGELRERIEYLDEERNRKLDQLILEWREKNRKKSLIERIFGK